MSRKSRRRNGSSRFRRTRSSRRMSRRKGMRGGLLKGGFVTQDLINFGRQMSFGASSAYRGLMGVNPPTNPSPLVQPIKMVK